MGGLMILRVIPLQDGQGGVVFVPSGSICSEETSHASQ
jgi:hypothetical protein